MSKPHVPTPNSQRSRFRCSGVGTWVVGLVSVLLLSSCAPRLLQLPTDPGAPAPNFAQAYDDATSACRGVKTLTAELGLSGQAGGRTIRGRAIIGFERPA